MRDELKARLIQEHGLQSEVRLLMAFEDVPGTGQPVPPGTRVVCPVDPTHLIKRLRVAGEKCPQHHVELVPEDQVANPQDEDETP